MRDMLEDAHKHMDDGFGRAQAHARKELPRRFYKRAGIEKRGEGWVVMLDERVTRTPGGQEVRVPSRALAELLAGEWEAQDSRIDATSMPAVRLVNSAVEGGVEAEQGLRDEIIKFAGNDLLLYRAESPRELVALQEERWGGVLDSLTRHFGVMFEPVTGIMHRPQPAQTLERLARDVADLDHFSGTCLVSVTGLTGSGLLALALRHGLVDGETAWSLAHLDEQYNARQWGQDAEALRRENKRRVEFDAAVRVLDLLG